VFLGIYRFDGNTDELLVGYRKLMDLVPSSSIHLHVCVRDARGLSIIDACPTREVFEDFVRGESFRELLTMAGLPTPTVTALGEAQSVWHQGARLI